jgi:hypothetical protein
MTDAASILQEAAALVSGDRNKTHGTKADNLGKTALVWQAYLDIRRPGPLTAEDAGHMMALMKMVRTQTGAHNPDDYVDGAGWFACAGEVAG